MIELNKTYCGDALETLKTFPDNFIDCCVTSPPYYGLRDYGNDKQLGLEKTPEEYIIKLTEVFSEVKRVLKKEGTLWLNLGDSYASGKSRYSTKPNTLESKENGEQKYGKTTRGERPDFYYHPEIKDKDLIGIPWTVAFALRKSGWWLRQDIIWAKKNTMPESVTDRCTKSHEYIFLLAKSARYYFDAKAIEEQALTPASIHVHTNGNKVAGLKGFETRLSKTWVTGETRNKRSVWTVATKPFPEAHFATFPPELIVDCIKAGCPENGIVLDPFMGAGTTALVAAKLNRNYIGIELNPKYISLAKKRLHDELGMFNVAI